MEGVGSRMGRTSSRYGQAPGFSGPVRKWKKKWVWVNLTPSSSTNNHHRNDDGNSAQPNNNVSAVRLCRWTPIPSTHSDDHSVTPEQPPKRKFRYTPTVVLEDKKKGAARRHDDKAKASKMNQSTIQTTVQSDEVLAKLNTQNAFTEEALTLDKLHTDKSHLDLDLSLKRLDDSHNLEDEIRDARLERESSAQFWMLNCLSANYKN